MTDATSTGSEATSWPGSRWTRSLVLHTIAAIFSFVFIEVFTAVVLFSTGLKLGKRGLGLVIGISAILLMGVGTIVAAGEESIVAIAIGYGARMVLTIAVPVLVGFALIGRGREIGTVLLAMLLAGGAGHGLIEAGSRLLADHSPYVWTLQQTLPGVESSIELQRSLGAPADRIEEVRAFMETFLTSYYAVIYAFTILLTSLVGLVALPRMGLTGQIGAGLLFRTLRLPDALLFGVVLGCLAPVYPEPFRTIGLNLLAIIALLYLVQGLAVMRSLVLRMQLSRSGIVLVWVAFGLMIVLSGAFLLTALAGVGLFDSFFDFRTPKNRENDDESDTY